MKNKKLYALFGLALAVALASCSDDEIIKGSPVENGTEVNFGAQLETSRSRTYYGEKNGNAFPIFWNDEAKGFDKIFIYAPDALAGRNQAYYSVRPASAGQTAPAPAYRIGDVGVQWGSTATKFYGFYPGNENFHLSAQGTTVSATLPGDQTITFDYKLDPNSASGHLFESNPDMSCVMMVAKTQSLEPTTDAVGLEFNPLSTVIDITVNGPEMGNTVNPYYVTSITLSANKQICGKFTYDYEKEEITAFEPEYGDSTITVRTMGLDTEGNYVGVPLYIDQKLNVKISMLPYTDIADLDLKVQVTTADSRVWTKTLDVTHLGAGQINPVELPKLRAKEAKLDFSRWISQFDPRIYISELSIPGSALAFNIKGYMAEGNDAYITQYGTLDEQFRAGSRIFQGHIWLVDGPSEVVGAEGTNHFEFVTSHGNPTGITLMRACSRLRQEMERSHSHGFCVLMLSDYKITAEGYTEYDYNQVYERFQDVTAELQKQNILAPEITPTTTIADVRGKIILKLQLNGRDIPHSGTTSANQTNTALRNLQTIWAPLAMSGGDQTKALFNLWNASAADNVYYSPMTFGRIGSFEFSEASGVNLGLINTYKGAAITQVTASGIAVEAAKLWIRNSSSTNAGNVNATTPPSSTELGSGMWYIYNEESQAGSHLSQCETNITNMISAITSTYVYKQPPYNKFYMTYVGGEGSSGGQAVKTRLNPHWMSATDAISQSGQNYPLGWVLFDDVTDNFTSQEENQLTRTCIERVIGQNTKSGFILERDRSASITPADSPGGDTKGTRKGGSVF